MKKTNEPKYDATLNTEYVFMLEYDYKFKENMKTCTVF